VEIAVLLFDRIILKNTNHKISAFLTLFALTCFTVWFKDVEDIFKEIEWAILFLILCGTTLFLFVLLLIEIIKFVLGEMVSKYFQERYTELEIKEFCHKFSTGKFYRSKWEYEGTGIDERYLGQLIQKLIDDEIIIPIDTTKRRDETDYKIKSFDKEKILRRIHSKIIKKEKEGKEEKRRNRETENLKKEKELNVFIHNEIDKIFMRTPIDYLKNFLKK